MKLKVGDVILKGGPSGYSKLGEISRTTEHFAFIGMKNLADNPFEMKFKIETENLMMVVPVPRTSDFYSYWVASEAELEALRVKQMIKRIREFPFEADTELAKKVYSLITGNPK